MSDFSHLSKLELDVTQTEEFPFYIIEGEPTLIVSIASESNKPYFNAVLKNQKRKAGRKSRLTAKTLAESRNEDRVLYPKFIVKGWKDVVDKDNNEVPFSEEDCKAFLKALPDHIFDELRTFVNDPSNFFKDEDDMDDEDLGESSRKD